MPFAIIAITCLSWLVSLASAAEGQVELPRTVQRAIAGYNESITEAEQRLLKALLDAEMVAARKKDEALVAALSAQREELLGIGGTAEMVRAQELLGAIPPSSTPEEWDAINGIELTVVASQLETPVPGITLRADQRIAVLAHPADTWTNSVEGNGYSSRGMLNTPHDAHGVNAPRIALLVKIGEEAPKLAEHNPHSGNGRVTLLINDDRPQDNQGEIRVKIVRLR